MLKLFLRDLSQPGFIASVDHHELISGKSLTSGCICAISVVIADEAASQGSTEFIV